MDTGKSCKVEEINSEEIIHLCVQSDPVTLQTCDNDLQKWLNLRQILVDETLKFTSGLAFFPLNMACR